MNLKMRLARLEKGNGTAEIKEKTMRMRTPEERKISMEVWLRCHQITHDEIDRDAALAYARELHEEPMVLTPCPPMPPDVRNELDRRRDEHEAERAKMHPAELAELEAAARERDRVIDDLLTEAAA